MSWIAFGSALWLGILTSISPCPLASNIAAISFISRKVDRMGLVLLSGALYTLGRAVAYMALGVVIMAGFLGGGEISRFLQSYLNILLGPVLILVGMVLLGLIGQGLSLNLAGSAPQEQAARRGVWWSFAMGVLFALSFCPVSAGLFFGGLLPLAVANQSRLVAPLVYGVGTAIPVLAFACIIAFASQYLGRAFNALSRVERFVRVGTGGVFILVGLYFSATHIYGLSLF